MTKVTLIQDGEDVILPLPQDIVDELGLKEGDCLEWDVRDNGSVVLRKINYDSDSGVEGRL